MPLPPPLRTPPHLESEEPLLQRAGGRAGEAAAFCRSQPRGTTWQDVTACRPSEVKMERTAQGQPQLRPPLRRLPAPGSDLAKIYRASPPETPGGRTAQAPPPAQPDPRSGQKEEPPRGSPPAGELSGAGLHVMDGYGPSALSERADLRAAGTAPRGAITVTHGPLQRHSHQAAALLLPGAPGAPSAAGAGQVGPAAAPLPPRPRPRDPAQAADTRILRMTRRAHPVLPGGGPDGHAEGACPPARGGRPPPPGTWQGRTRDVCPVVSGGPRRGPGVKKQTEPPSSDPRAPGTAAAYSSHSPRSRHCTNLSDPTRLTLGGGTRAELGRKGWAGGQKYTGTRATVARPDGGRHTLDHDPGGGHGAGNDIGAQGPWRSRRELRKPCARRLPPPPRARVLEFGDGDTDPPQTCTTPCGGDTHPGLSRSCGAGSLLLTERTHACDGLGPRAGVTVRHYAPERQGPDACLRALFTAVPRPDLPPGWFRDDGDSQGRRFPGAHTPHVEVQTKIKNLGTSLPVVARLRRQVAKPGYYRSKQYGDPQALCTPRLRLPRAQSRQRTQESKLPPPGPAAAPREQEAGEDPGDGSARTREPLYRTEGVRPEPCVAPKAAPGRRAASARTLGLRPGKHSHRPGQMAPPPGAWPAAARTGFRGPRSCRAICGSARSSAPAGLRGAGGGDAGACPAAPSTEATLLWWAPRGPLQLR
ncbi:collagen alpha-1(I) chain-like [Phyllostomus discolor]|uniref:Collagen alpha-1(I) chain-like n=1 Tax=Phyllostomus discolor TaxID=89673 RepID=A0A7E6CDB5_9CHIR|nr:collagen alpha-1(I) chain-like [Phyllostomus discolor]